MAIFFDHASQESAWTARTAELPDLSDISASGSAEAAQKARRMTLLSEVVIAEILPRLAIIRQSGERDGSRVPQMTTSMDTGELVRLLLVRDEAAGMGFIQGVLSRGVTVESLYTGLLPDAARWLGVMWEEDRCDFALVTIAVGRLQQAARILSPRFRAASVNRPDVRSLLLMPTPGEQHTFGAQILAEFFQRAGWRVAGGPMSSSVDARDMVRRNWFDVVGFSIGSEKLLDGLITLIRLVRRASRNRGLGVMIGGPLVQLRPELVALVGADASADDAPAALTVARGLAMMRVSA